MSAKRPRPAIPVLVHVDNPTEAASIVVDTSTIEGKMDTVINNQERIYNKIPTSTGGGSSADLTTVNANTTALVTAIGPTNSTTDDINLLGLVKNLRSTIGKFGTQLDIDDTTIRSFLYNIRNAVGGSSSTPTATGTTVRDLLTALKTVTGTLNSSSKDSDLIGCVRNLRVAVGASGNQLLPGGDSVRSFLLNLRTAIGNSTIDPSLTGNTVRDLLLQIKTTTGPITSGLTDNNLFGFVKNISASIGDGNSTITSNATHLRSLLYNIRQAVGSATTTPTATGSTVRDLLTAIKENTASGGGGGGGGSADLTTVNEKTTALAAAIGSASDDSSTVSVIGLLKSITDKY